MLSAELDDDDDDDDDDLYTNLELYIYIYSLDYAIHETSFRWHTVIMKQKYYSLKKHS